MKTQNHDFFYFDPAFNGELVDFTNNEIFSPEQRKDFLTHYSSFLQKTLELPEESQKPVTEEEAMRITSSVASPIDSPKVSKRIDITHMDAALVKKTYTYENWSLYTARAVVEGDALSLKGDPLPPNPGAAYYLDGKERVREIELSIYMDPAYKNGITSERVGLVTAHRLISLRKGINDILNINIYPNGECKIQDPENNLYNPTPIMIGTLGFGKWHTLKITIGEENYTVSLDGGEPASAPMRCFDIPDMLFFSCGMFQMGEWKIKPLNIVTENRKITDFFVPSKDAVAEEEKVGEVSLPYSIGNYHSCDKMIVLRKDFEAEAGAKAYLTVGSLDPGGRVYLDGVLVAETDSFEQLKIDITDALKKQKKHHLEIQVDPRAPEVLFRWHRNIDPYNGWFCEDVTVDIINDIEITEPKVITLTAGRGKAKVNFSCKTSKPCKVKVYLAHTWPEKKAEKLLGCYESDGFMTATVDFDKIDLWEAEDPVLYNVRFEALNDAGLPADDTVIETGFRTVEQKNGAIYINGKKTTMKGALVMQYLPPHSETATTHICPRDWQIVWQYMMLKKMGGNMLRLHILGYGTNDVRFARYADRLGVMLVWITRYIDSIEQLEWEGPWRAKDGYIRQISLRLNHPSIVIWEGSNEFHPTLEDVDSVHKQYVPAVKKVDTSRLICPLSHHYYAGAYGIEGCNYYNNDGTKDAFGKDAKAPEEWTDPLVIRSAHPYVYSMGYGFSWENFITQPWAEQCDMAASRDRAYLATEFAVIARQDHTTKEAREIFFQPYTYEFPNENILGFKVTQDDWRISQAYQALCISYAVRKFRIMDFDGMLWCCLMGGANDAGYLKPPIDSYGYAKYGFYTMKENFKTVTCLNDTSDTKRGKGFAVKPVLFAFPGDTRTVTVSVIDEQGTEIDSKVYSGVECDDYITRLPEWKPEIPDRGYYAVKTVVK